MLSVPIFIILMGLLVTISNLTAIPWNNEPTGQTFETLASDTAVTFDNPQRIPLAHSGQYGVRETDATIDVTRPSTGEVQTLRMIIREPADAPAGARHPGVVFLHGAGHGTVIDSFGDVAGAMASAGFVTAVVDKPSWSTTDVNRDYPGSAAAYDQVVDLLRARPDVDPDKIGIYATSESSWITGPLLELDPGIAFQIVLSPMVYSPRHSLGFFVAQDFALVGAHDGYQSIVRRVFSVDSAMLGLPNLDFSDLRPATYGIPTFVAYGAKDVMTAQVEGTETILDLAHRAGNWDVTIRSYPVANHVMRLGNEAEVGYPFADDYLDDVIDWASGTVEGLTQTSERVAGQTLYQSIAVPRQLKANRAGTIYGLLLHGTMLLSLLASGMLALVALGRRIAVRLRRIRHGHGRGVAGRGIVEQSSVDRKLDDGRRGDGDGARGQSSSRPVLGYSHGFGGILATLSIATLATLAVFFAGLGQVIWGVVQMAWGAAPPERPGVMWWSWPFIQIVCTLVVWAWSRVLARVIEVASPRGLIHMPPDRGAIRGIVTGADPVIASTRLGRVLFWLTAYAMFSVLLFFAFWGLFVY